jgi:hypothetical protein
LSNFQSGKEIKAERPEVALVKQGYLQEKEIDLQTTNFEQLQLLN